MNLQDYRTYLCFRQYESSRNIILLQIMLIEIIASLLLIAAAYLIRNWYIYPSKLMQRYAAAAREKGYRVWFIPYNPFYNRFSEVTYKHKAEGDPLKILREEYPKYDIIITNVMNKPFVQFLHPDFIRDFYSVGKNEIYQKTIITRNFMNRVTGITLGGSEGLQWKRKRTALNAVFNFEFVKSHIPKIALICQKTMEEFERENAKDNHQVSYNILDLSVRIFSKIILMSFLGYEGDEKLEGEPVAVYLKTLMDQAMLNGIDLWSFFLGENYKRLGIKKADRILNRRIGVYNGWAQEYVRKRISELNKKIKNNQKSQHPSDIIEALLREKQKNKEDSNIGSEEQILSAFNGFFFSGTDTTSNYFQMMVYYILGNPKVEEKLRQEIKAHMKEEDYSYENLKKFTYIDGIQKQTTRMYGPGNLIWPRQAAVDNTVNGMLIKKGTISWVVHYGNHHSEKYFKNPLQFKPERWEEECSDLPPFAFGGFNAGPRTCIGKHLALIQSKVALIKFFKRYAKAQIPKSNYNMDYKLVPVPERFDTLMTLVQ